MSSSVYRVRFYPRVSTERYSNTPIDVTEFLIEGGFNSLKRTIDDGDYFAGVFSLNNIKLTLFNQNKMFNNDLTSFNSIFFFQRDKTLVEIDLLINNEEFLVFKGIINEEATRQDPTNNYIKFEVLSLESILRKERIGVGIIPERATFRTALTNLLSTSPIIISLLDISENEFNLGIDDTIDEVSWFIDKSILTGINTLLNASSSILILRPNRGIEKSIAEVYSREIRDRGVARVFNIRDESLGDHNILKVKDFNSGLHRAFNTVTVNNLTEEDINFSNYFSRRPLNIELPFLTSQTKIRRIANRILQTFKTPKTELKLTVPTKDVIGIDLLSLVRIQSRQQVGPSSSRIGEFIIGDGVIGGGVSSIDNSLGISELTAFFCYGIKHNLKNATSEIHLREIGIGFNDALFNTDCLIIGEGIIGEANICPTVEPFDFQANERPVIGQFIIGLAKIGE